MAWFGETLSGRHGAKDEAGGAMGCACPGSEWEREQQTTCRGGGAVESDKRGKSSVRIRTECQVHYELRRTEQAPRIRYHRQAELEFRNVDSGTNRVPELNLHPVFRLVICVSAPLPLGDVLAIRHADTS